MRSPRSSKDANLQNDVVVVVVVVVRTVRTDVQTNTFDSVMNGVKTEIGVHFDELSASVMLARPLSIACTAFPSMIIF